MKKLRLGILGASSLLAKDILAWLDKWHFPYEDIYLCDKKEFCGTILFCNDKYHSIQEVNEQKLASITLCFICDETLYEKYEEQINKSCYSINLTNHYPKEMMILPPFSLDMITGLQKHFWIPSASICTLLHVVNIAREHGNIQRVYLTSMHSAGELGIVGSNELLEQLKSYKEQRELDANVFPLPSAFQHLPLLFQVLPQTSNILANGEAQEEHQLQTCMNDFLHEEIEVFSTCVRIASMRGLAMSVQIRFTESIQLDSLMDAYASSSTCVCFDDKEHNMYPILADVLHDYRVFIGRMRSTAKDNFSAWAVCDDQSIRCGAAVQVAFYLYHNFLKDM